MRDFVYNYLTDTINFFYWTFYPLTIFFLIYICWVVIKNKKINIFVLAVFLTFAILPSILAITYTILEIAYIPSGYGWTYLMLYFGIGIFLNLVSTILMITFYINKAKSNKKEETTLLI